MSIKPKTKHTQDNPKPIVGTTNQYFIDKNKYKIGTNKMIELKNLDDEISSGDSLASVK